MLRQKLQDDQIAALKAGDREKVSVLRFILAQIKNREMEKNPPAGAELTDEETVTVLRKFVKELNESIAAFEKGGRADLVESNKKQLSVVIPYLPAEMTDDQLKKEIDRIIADNKTVFDQNPKAIIGICMKQLKNKADPAKIIKTLQPYLKS